MTPDTRGFERYQQILFWPLELCKRKNWTLETEAEDLTGVWRRIPDPLHRPASSGAAMSYQEFVYFHPFAQSFLYSHPEYQESVYLFERTDVGRVRIEFQTTPASEETLDVLRVNLYVFKTQIAILVVEVAADRPVSRDNALRLENVFRRIYPPYFKKPADPRSQHQWDGGECPHAVEWMDRHGAPIPTALRSDYEQKTTLEQSVLCMPAQGSNAFFRPDCRPDRRPPIAAHWKWLLGPLRDIKQIMDDRAPCMIFIVHPNPPTITEMDLVRHCFYDGPDSPTEWPFSPAFLADFKKHEYTRFWVRDESDSNWKKTLYLCSGFGFTVITVPNALNGQLIEHFRHHYFQLGLLAHFHRASLLRFSSRFNESLLDVPEAGTGSGKRDKRDDKRKHERLREVRRDFAEFIATSWFHEVSNQDQGKELFQFWTEQLGSEKLMKDILVEAGAVDGILGADQQRLVNERIDRLTILLYGAAVAAVAIALVDTEVVRKLVGIDEKHLWEAALKSFVAIAVLFSAGFSPEIHRWFKGRRD